MFSGNCKKNKYYMEFSVARAKIRKYMDRYFYVRGVLTPGRNSTRRNAPAGLPGGRGGTRPGYIRTVNLIPLISLHIYLYRLNITQILRAVQMTFLATAHLCVLMTLRLTATTTTFLYHVLTPTMMMLARFETIVWKSSLPKVR